MRDTPVRLLVLVLLSLSVATSAIAQDGGATEPTPPEGGAMAPLELVLITHTTGSGGYFTLEGETARNPVLKAQPGQEVRVTIRAADEGTHNFCVGRNMCSEYVSAAGDEATYTFSAPETGTLEYYCLPHRAAGMKGTLTLATAAPAPTTPTPEPEGPAGPLELVIETHTTPGGGYFTIAGDTTRNPIIRAKPGQEIRVTIKATDEGTHNFCIGKGMCSEYVNVPGDEATYTFTAPETGTLEYYCLPHRAAGMKGTLTVAAATGGETPSGGGDAGVVTGETIDLGAEFPNNPACQGKQASALVKTDQVGLPRLADYDNPNCATGYQPPTPKSGADYVIPISWALIALGVVGVVWVHKFYDP